MPFKITVEASDEPTLNKAMLLVEVIQSVMDKLDKQPRKSPLKWTASRTALVEIIYAFHAGKVFNNGDADIRQITDTLSKAFNFSIPNSYRTFQDIIGRESSPTAFLEVLKKKLEQHIAGMNS